MGDHRRERKWAVLFDGDGTLWEYEPSMLKALELTLEELWSLRPETVGRGMTVDRMVSIRNEVAEELAGRVNDLAAVRVAAFDRTLELLEIPDASLGAEIAASFFSHRTRLLTARREAEGVLAAIENYEVGYVTNGTSYPADVGLGEYFSVTLRSIDYGAPKPHPGMLLAAAAYLGVDAERTVMVGDNQVEDIGAANAAGMRSILVADSADAGFPRPDRVVASLADVPGAVSELVDSASR